MTRLQEATVSVPSDQALAEFNKLSAVSRTFLCRMGQGDVSVAEVNSMAHQWIEKGHNATPKTQSQKIRRTTFSH